MVSEPTMVEVCTGTAGATTLALVAAAHQTGGLVVCILNGLDELQSSEDALGPNLDGVEFVTGDARSLLMNYYKEADFMLIGCSLDDHDDIFRAVQTRAQDNGAVVVDYNAFCKGSWWNSRSKTQLLPIGEGLLVTRIPATIEVKDVDAKKSHRVVSIDKCKGEEHMFRIRSPQRKGIQV